MSNKTIAIYGAGGFGINITQQFQRFAGQKDPGFAKITPYFIDTSKSNMLDEVPENTYLFDGLDGSGKLRSSNYAVISERCKEILHKFKPADVNIVVHSAAGGSGSTAGPVLVSELLSRNETVIVLLGGSTASKIETENTKKTLQSYEVISQKRDKPVICFYRENTKDTPRGAVDNQMQTAVVILAAIFSGANRELESADLGNWINYNRVTSYSPKLNLLEFHSGTIKLNKGQSLISLATLTDDNHDSGTEVPVEYQCVGYVSPEAQKAISMEMPIHASIVGGVFNETVARLEARLAVYDEARAVVVEKSIIKNSSASTDDGLIL
jgi:hypothetical protein